jgi:hypothetical protein
MRRSLDQVAAGIRTLERLSTDVLGGKKYSCIGEPMQ